MSDGTIVQGFIPGDKRPYVYGLFYPASMSGSCFYVGKGTNLRVLHHERDARCVPHIRTPKHDAIRSVWACGLDVEKRIFSYFDSDQEALLYEAASILFMSSNLTNEQLRKQYPSHKITRVGKSVVWNGETYLSSQEALRILRVSRQTLSKLVHQGKIRRYSRGMDDNSFYKLSEVNSLLDVHEVPPEARRAAQ